MFALHNEIDGDSTRYLLGLEELIFAGLHADCEEMGLSR